jgi:ParB family transcriptional regulator, chromosome partitioning protein
MNAPILIKPVEIVHVDPAFAHTRIRDDRSLARLTVSFRTYGQLVPVFVVPADHPRFTLIDGYLRLEAARCCGWDTLSAHVWDGNESEAILHVLAASGDRRQWDLFEQAAMLRELQARHHLSQAQLAHRLGKHQSWVSRRLALLDSLSPSVQESVRLGHISSWAACRVIVPMARANPAHAEELTRTIAGRNLSTRNLAVLFTHYKKAGQKVRARMVSEPVLFLASLETTIEKPCGDKDCPEHRWHADIRMVGHILDRLAAQASTVFHPCQDRLQSRRLATAFDDTHAAWQHLYKTIRRLTHETTSRQRGRQGNGPGRLQYPPHQPHHEHVPQHRAQDPSGTRPISAIPDQQI